MMQCSPLGEPYLSWLCCKTFSVSVNHTIYITGYWDQMRHKRDLEVGKQVILFLLSSNYRTQA